VCAGFGVRDPQQVRLIGEHADGVIVGSALIEALEQRRGVRDFLNELRGRQAAGA
jgi:tryptophan synthase alpha chain